MKDNRNYSDRASSTQDIPAAHLNYILFDANMNFYDAGFQQVTNTAFMPPKTLSFNDIYIPENGYIFIYTSYTSDGISASKGFFFTSASPWGVNLSVEADFLIFGELVIPIIVEYTELNELLRLMQDIQNIAPQLLEQINRIEFGGSYGNSNSSDLPATANYSIDPIYLFDFKLLNK